MVFSYMSDGLRESAVLDDIPNLLTWATTHRSMLIPDRPFDLDGHKYLKAIYECQAKTMVVYKAAQMGISEYLLSYALHACDKRKATVLYIFPNDGLISDFSTARLSPAIEASDYLASIVHDHTGSTGKKGANRVTLKRIRDRFLYMRGGQVKPDGKAPQLKSVDADLCIIDEIDEEGAIGRSKADAPEIDGMVYLNDPDIEVEVGDIVRVEITHSDEHDLWGELV